MNYAPGIMDPYAAIERRRTRVRRLVFDALGLVCVVAVLAGAWWVR